MARGGKAAGFWMMRRRKKTGLDPDNPHNLPEITVGTATVFFNTGLSDTVLLFLTNDLNETLTVSNGFFLGE